MRGAVLKEYSQCTAVIMAAAVADYQCRRRCREKNQAGSGSGRAAPRAKAPDILKELGQNKDGKWLVGFAAETEDLIANAQKKLREKNLDMVVANNVVEDGSGFDGDTNIATIVDRTGATRSLPLMSKDDLADCIYDHYLALKKPALKWELLRAQSGEVFRRAALIQPRASRPSGERSSRILGEVDGKSEALSWAASKYYEKEMGPGLLRCFFSFSTLASPENPCRRQTANAEDRRTIPCTGSRRPACQSRSRIPRLLQSCSGLD